MRIRGIAIFAVVSVLLGVGVLASPSASATLAPWVVVHRGDSGLKVRAVQALLREHGYEVMLTSHFRFGTEKAVKQFQADHGIHVTGVVDKTTWPTLVVVLRRGETGPAVKVVQRALTFLGFYDAVVGGHFGPKTEAAVKHFQDNWVLPETGTVTGLTWRYLMATVGSGSCFATCDE